MLPLSLDYWIFFSIFFLGWQLIENPRLKRYAIVISGIAFCWQSSPLSAAWMLLVSVTTLRASKLIERTEHQARRQHLMLGSVALVLMPLILVKFTPLLYHPGEEAPSVLSFGTPVLGLSFYTLQCIGYIVDIAQGAYQMNVDSKVLLASNTMVPVIPSGPILRASVIFPQLQSLPRTDATQIRSGLLIVSVGLFKKTLADLLSSQSSFSITDTGFTSAWISALVYTSRLYADFSGYSDIAVGSLLLLGLRIPSNFNLPFISKDPIEFWTRWHISLSSWLRDYVFFPIADSSNKARSVLALLVTMTIAGLWHGTGWIYIIWGLYWGLLLIIFHLISRQVGIAHTNKPSAWIHVSRIGLNFYFVLVGFSIFNSASISHAIHWIRISHGIHAIYGFDYSQCLIIAVALLSLIGVHLLDYWVGNQTREGGEVVQKKVIYLVIVLSLATVFVFASGSKKFVYQNF